MADQGPGMPEELRPRLFTRFFTTPSPATGQAGNGLGLSIARAIVEAHGGQLDHEPGQPRGSVFSFTLPTTPASDGPA